MNNFRENDILLLIGAGCSKEAGIPTSVDMINEIDKLVENDEWSEYKKLYLFIKSSIFYADGLKGMYNEPLNIERLVNTLSELEKKEEHPIYPFIGSWNAKVSELCGSDFRKITSFKKKILQKLKSWVTIPNYDSAKYYKHIFNFSDKLEFCLRIFSLNYDLCMEKNQDNHILERGFDSARIWQWQRFERNDNEQVNIYLCKMHGSIDWERRGDDRLLTYSDEVSQIGSPDLIFGTNYKLQYLDPYLFFAYEFRKYTLDARLIITIGYGYGDEHINCMIGQAMKNRKETKLLVNLYEKNKDDAFLQNMIKTKIGIDFTDNSQFILHNMKSSDFLENELQIDKLAAYCPEDEIFRRPIRM